MPIHVVARGALIGGGVGAAIAVLRGARAKDERTGSGLVRVAKSVAEGALAGAAVGFALDRRLRGRAAALVAEHGPDLLETVTDVVLPRAVELATQAYDTARPQVELALESARPAVEELARQTMARAAARRAG